MRDRPRQPRLLNSSLTLGAGELSAAELVRLRTVAHGRATEFARASDREITRIFLTFVVRTDDAGVGTWQSVARADRNWQSSSPHPRLVKKVYMLDTADQGV